MARRGWARRWSWVLGVLAAIVLVPVAAACVAVAVLDPNDYKPVLVDAVRNATGRTLTMKGPLRISRSLWPTIEASELTLANIAGGSRPDLARIERIEAQLALPSLLWHQIEVVRLTLVGPDILFEEAGGKPNWVFDPPPDPDPAPADATAPAPAATTGATTATPFRLRIRHIHVQNGMVTWRFAARTKVVGLRVVDLRHRTDGGPVDLDGVFVYSDNQPFRLSASAQPTQGIAGPWKTRLDFAAFDTAASAEGTMDIGLAYDLQIEAKSGNLASLNGLLPEMRLPPVREAVLSTHVTNGPRRGDLPVIGATRLRFASADLTGRVAGLTLGASRASLDAAGGNAKVDGAGQFARQKFTLAGEIGVPAHPDGRASVPIDLQAKAAPDGSKAAEGSLALKGNVALDTLRFAGLDASASLRTPALAALRPLLGERLPKLTDVRFDGHVTVPGDVGSLTIKDARLAAHQGDLAGDGTLGLGGGAALEARLRSARLDMDATLDAFGIDLPTPSPGRTGRVMSEAPLPWAALRGPVIDVSGTIGEMRFQGETWQKVDLALRLKGGRLQVGPLRLALPDGPAEMTFTADASRDTAAVSVEMHAPGIPLGLVARYAELPGTATGAMRVEARLTASGRTAHDLAASLGGPVSATVVGGRLSNAAFVTLTAASLNALGIKVPAQGETALRCLGVVGTFSKGVGRFRTIALDTTYLQLDGSGEVDLGQETVALKLNPLAQISGSQVAVPVVVEGPFRGIAGRLDADGLDKLGLLIDAWFGGDQPDTCSDAGLVPAKRR